MNCIYKYTNLDKVDGSRYYIGSKTECSIIDLDGVPVILDNKSQTPYYGSSCNPEMAFDMQSGNRMSAEVLEIVCDRDKLRTTERDYLENVDAANNGDYYNLSNNTLSGTKYNHNAPANYLGETIKELANNKSSTSKRDALADELGFDNFASLYIHAYDLISSGEYTPASFSRSINKDRHYFGRILAANDILAAKEELESLDKEEFIPKIRGMVDRSVSLQKISQHLGLEFITVRALAGDYYRSKSRTNLRGNLNSALVHGLTENEMLDTIGMLVLEGKSMAEIGEKVNVSSKSVSRYIRKLLERVCTEEDFPNHQKRFLGGT